RLDSKWIAAECGGTPRIHALSVHSSRRSRTSTLHKLGGHASAHCLHLLPLNQGSIAFTLAVQDRKDSTHSVLIVDFYELQALAQPWRVETNSLCSLMQVLYFAR